MNRLKKYRKRPLEILARELDETEVIHTPEGDMIAGIGDYYCVGVMNEHYLMKKEIFEMSYDQIEK